MYNLTPVIFYEKVTYEGSILFIQSELHKGTTARCSPNVPADPETRCTEGPINKETSICNEPDGRTGGRWLPSSS